MLNCRMPNLDEKATSSARLALQTVDIRRGVAYTMSLFFGASVERVAASTGSGQRRELFRTGVVETGVKKRGELVLFQHGLYSDRNSFKVAIDELSHDSDFINFGIITKRPSDKTRGLLKMSTDKRQGALPECSITINLANTLQGYNDLLVGKLIEAGLEIVEEDVEYIKVNMTGDNSNKIKNIIKCLQDEGKNVLVQTEFSNNNGSHREQIDELDSFIKGINPDDNKVILVGHSKGGIVSVGYTAKGLNADNVKRTITVCTPYHPNSVAKFAERVDCTGSLGARGEGTRDLAGWSKALEEIRNNWNGKKIAERVSAHAIGCVATPGIGPDSSDGTVNILSQAGKGFEGIKASIIHVMEDTFESTFHTKAPDNSKVLCKLRSLVLGESYTLNRIGLSKEYKNMIVEQLPVGGEDREILLSTDDDVISCRDLKRVCKRNKDNLQYIQNLLSYAIKINNKRAVEIIIKFAKENGLESLLDANQIDIGLRPIQYAILNSHNDIANYLIENLSSPEQLYSLSADRLSVFHIAALIGNYEMFHKLVEKTKENYRRGKSYGKDVKYYLEEKSSSLNANIREFSPVDIVGAMLSEIYIIKRLAEENRIDEAKELMRANFGIAAEMSNEEQDRQLMVNYSKYSSINDILGTYHLTQAHDKSLEGVRHNILNNACDLAAEIILSTVLVPEPASKFTLAKLFAKTASSSCEVSAEFYNDIRSLMTLNKRIADLDKGLARV